MAKKAVPQKVRKAIDDYLEVLKEDNLPISSVFLFGSYAKGKQHKWSDIDICVISPKFKDAWSALQYLWSKRVVDDPAFTVEPVGYSPKDFADDSSLTYEIKKTGIKIL